MRLLLKFAVIVMLAIGCQWFLLRGGADELDEAAFTVRILIANVRGEPLDDPKFLDAAWRLHERAFERERRTSGHPCTRPTAPPALAAVDEW